jgi:uncharacterized protein (TIGR03000 family)
MNAAHIRVFVPEGAKLWFEGTPTSQTGSVRFFTSPELQPGRSYAYHVRAEWMVNGAPVSKSREVTVHSGDAVTVNFKS